MGEIGTDENFGDKTGGDRPREHCSFLYTESSVADFHKLRFKSNIIFIKNQ
jgi:hypothetical protein